MDFIQSNVFYGAYIPFICQRVHNVKTMQFYFIIVNKLLSSFQIFVRIYIKKNFKTLSSNKVIATNTVI